MRKILCMSAMCFALMLGSTYAGVEPGTKAPNFSLSDVHGQTQSLEANAGKIVVLEWFNYDCPFVKKHYLTGNMQSLQKKYTGKGVVWFSINSSAPGKQGYYESEALAKLAEENRSASTAVLRDPTGEVGKLYGAMTTPHLFVIDKTGTLVYQGAIDDKPSADQADVPSAKSYIAEALDSVLTGEPVVTSSTKSYGCSVKY